MSYLSETEQLKRKLNRLVDRTKDNYAVLERFQSFEMQMLAGRDLSALLNDVLIKSIRHFDLSDCRLVWFEHKMPLHSFVEPDLISQLGHRLVFSELQAELEGMFSQSSTPHLCALNPEEKEHWFPSGTQVLSAAFIPLVCQGNLLGTLLFGSPDLERFNASKATDFMARMGLILAVCLQNNIHREQIRLLSMLDNLTQVKNRRCFDQDMKTEVARARRNNLPLSCLFIDADFFKQVNDNYGHPGGDETLVCMSRWIQQQLRDGDHLARFGGEEFAVLLPQCNERLAFDVAERIRAYVASQTIHFQESDFSITLSIGVSTFTPALYVDMPAVDVAEKLVAFADLGVYDAKNAGRNQVKARLFEASVDAMMAP